MLSKSQLWIKLNLELNRTRNVKEMTRGFCRLDLCLKTRLLSSAIGFSASASACLHRTRHRGRDRYRGQIHHNDFHLLFIFGFSSHETQN